MELVTRQFLLPNLEKAIILCSENFILIRKKQVACDLNPHSTVYQSSPLPLILTRLSSLILVIIMLQYTLGTYDNLER